LLLCIFLYKILTFDALVINSIDTNLVYRDEYEKRIVATFKYQPTTEQSKETCQKLIKASHSFDLKNSH
jgi:hypothetical protein